MTTNAEYVAPRAEEQFCILQRHDINKSRENMLCERFCFALLFALGTTVV